jgi:hypothetical protein
VDEVSGTLVLVVVVDEVVDDVDALVEVVGWVVLVGRFSGRTIASGLRTLNAAHRARGPWTGPQTACDRTGPLPFPAELPRGAAPPASAPMAAPPAMSTAATAAQKSLRETARLCIVKS